MVHPILQSVADFIDNTVPFRTAEYCQVVDKLSEANAELNRAILKGTVNGFDVPSIERQMSALRIQASHRRSGHRLPARPRSPQPVSPKLAKVIPFEVGMLKRQITSVS
jgi:hypothetical protein